MRVNKKYLFIIPSVLLTFLLFIHPAAHALKDSTVKTKKHFLWSVESERNTVYLLGSIHIMKRNSYPLPQKIESIYGCCKKMIFEADIEGAESPAAQKKVLMMALYPEGHTLSQNISGQTYTLLVERLEKLGLPPSQFERFKPWSVAQQIAVLELVRLGYDPGLGIDRYFFNKAKKDGKEISFLESVDYQRNLFAGLAKRQQERLLNQILKDIDVVEENISTIMDSWKNGDVDTLDSIFKISFKEYPDLLKRFLTNRNKRWISKIKKLMQGDDDVLIVVGAGHLVGKDSVVELLKKKGYKVGQL